MHPAVLAALNASRPPRVAPGSPPPAANVANGVVGALKAPVAGRTDHLPISVPQGAYVIPADVVSALGQGNTRAGEKVCEGMFGPSAALPPGAPPGGNQIDIMAAGGEFIVSPQSVARCGNGNIKLGHAALDKWVKKVRADNVQTLRQMPGPRP